MKRLAKFIVCVIMVFCTFSFIACGNNNQAQPPANPPPPTTPAPIEPQKLAELDIIGAVYKSANDHFKSTTITEPRITQEYDKFIAVQLGLLDEISKLSIDKMGYYSGEEVNLEEGQANKLERFYISCSKLGGNSIINLKLLFSRKGDDLFAQNAKSYVLVVIDLTYEQDTSYYDLIINYENSKYSDKGRNFFEANTYNFELQKRASGISYDLDNFNRDDYVGSTYSLSDIQAFRGHINNCMFYRSQIDYLMTYDDETLVLGNTRNDEIEILLGYALKNQSVLQELLEVPAENIKSIDGLSQKLAKYANAKTKSEL